MKEIQSIKYRVAGALVIVISLGLAWWLLLDHEVNRYTGPKQEIPKPIVIERFEIQELEKPKAPEVKVSKITEAKAKPTKKATENKVTDKKATKTVAKKVVKQPKVAKVASLDAKGLPIAWVLQVASFTKKSNAKQLEKKLTAKNIPAYVKTFKLSSGNAFRVLVGPKLSKKRASALAKTIEKDFRLKSIVMQFKPGFEE